MQTPYSGSAIPWEYPLFTRRTVQTNCEVVFDFDWESVIGHNQPKFSGLHDLSQAVDQFAKTCAKTPLLLLSDKADVAFDELISDAVYVAVVNIQDFLACTTGHDRSAMFFLKAISKHGTIAAASAGTSMPIRVQQLLKALEDGMGGTGEALIEAVSKGGSKLTLALLDAAVKGLEKTSSRNDMKILAELFSASSASVVADAAIAGRRRLAIQEFEKLLDADATELEFQPWFETNAWVLGSDCVRVLDARRIDVRNVADLLVEAYDGRADIVELKRPRLGFWLAKKDHDNYVPHPDLVAAVVQAQNYQFALEGEIDSVKTQKRLQHVPIAKPSSLLIHGRSNNWTDEHFEAQRLLNAGFTNLTIITFDQVLRRASVIMERPVRSSPASIRKPKGPTNRS